MSDPSKPHLQLRDLTAGFGSGNIFQGVTLSVPRGQTLVVLGESGCGKSTLLNVLGSLDTPDRGSALLGAVSLFDVKAASQARLRNEAIGFVFQFHHLLPEFTAIENVAMKMRLRGVDDVRAHDAARVLLERFGLAARLHHAPDALSGGEQQRVAVARALVGDPVVLLADEPTGNLDPKTAAALFEELHTVARERGIAILWATHNESLATRSDRILRLQDGVLVAAS